MQSIFQLRRTLHRQEPLTVYYVLFEPTIVDKPVVPGYVIAGSPEEAHSLVEDHQEIDLEHETHVSNIEETEITTFDELVDILVGEMDIPVGDIDSPTRRWTSEILEDDIPQFIIVNTDTALSATDVTTAGGRQISQAVTVL